MSSISFKKTNIQKRVFFKSHSFLVLLYRRNINYQLPTHAAADVLAIA